MWEPMFCSLGAWSSESLGFLMNVVSRAGSVLAHKRKSTSLVLCTSQSSSTTTLYLLNIICPISPQTVHDFERLIRILLSNANRKTILLKSGHVSSHYA